MIHQASGIVIRPGSTGTRVLVVTSRRRPDRWIFPKGRIESGERAGAAARREVEEEAGVMAALRDRLGAAHQLTRRGLVRVEYYLLEYTRTRRRSPEGRRVRWRPLDDAMQLLSSRAARRMLRRAARRAAKWHEARR
jgi:8-oxo-dGTP diphosphatase